MNADYVETVRLLLAVTPSLFREPVFAMKGGTAINLFHHDMPRLSVDLDLVFADLAGHNRPVHEVLFANEIEIGAAFANEFEGMTREPVSLDDLLAIRRRLFTDLPASLTRDQCTFLMSLVEAEPNWSLISCAHLAAMPATRWKLTNLERLRRTNAEKFSQQATELRERF